MQRTVDFSSPPLPYLPFPIALERLRKRLGASPQEVAAWLFLSGRSTPCPEGAPSQRVGATARVPERGELHAYLHANELDKPPRFSFDALSPDPASDPLDYLSPLAACWFRREDVDRFEPADRFITGSAPERPERPQIVALDALFQQPAPRCVQVPEGQGGYGSQGVVHLFSGFDLLDREAFEQGLRLHGEFRIRFGRRRRAATHPPGLAELGA